MSRLEHFAVFAADPSSLKDFYVSALGLRVVQDNGQSTPPGYFLADDAGVALEIIGRPPSAAPCDTRYVCHVAFSVADVAASRRELEERGLTFEHDTEVDTPRMKTCFFRDPEGNRCQVVWRAEPLAG